MNKYISLLRSKLLNINENVVGEYGSHGNFYDDYYDNNPAQTGVIKSDPNEVVNVNIKKNPDGTQTVTLTFGNGRTKVDVIRDQHQLRKLLGL